MAAISEKSIRNGKYLLEPRRLVNNYLII